VFLVASLAPGGHPEVEAGQSEVVGYYSDGAIKGPSRLPDVAPGLMKLFLGRDRAYGAESLVDLLLDVAQFMSQTFPSGERLQVGDLSAHSGGRITRHSSHQNGLDVDLRYFAVDTREQDLSWEDGFDEDFVRNGKLSSNFDRLRNWELLRALVSSGKVQRVFVDAAIKKAYCLDYARGSQEERDILRRLRPYTNHSNHLHLRLFCPEGSPRCQSQPEVPAGTGCSGAMSLMGDTLELDDEH